MTSRLICASLLVASACTATTKSVLSTEGESGDESDSPWENISSCPDEPCGELTAVTGTGPHDVVAVGREYNADSNVYAGKVVRWDGSKWTTIHVPTGLLSVSGDTAVGEYNGAVSATSWNGAGWSAPETLDAGTFRSIWQTAGGAWAVGSQRFGSENRLGIVAFSADPTIPGSWRTTADLVDQVTAVWGSSANDVYMVGENGTILHSTTGDGGVGLGTSAESHASLTGVWGSSADDIYIVGNSTQYSGGLILHSTDGGKSWTTTELAPRSNGFKPYLYAVGGRSPSDVYVVGASQSTAGGYVRSSVIYHSSGDDIWHEQAAPDGGALTGVWVAGTGEAYAVGQSGILHKAP